MRQSGQRTIIDRMMAERITMPGCPQLIVTRADAWHFLASLGCETDTRKTQFGSVDYMGVQPEKAGTRRTAVRCILSGSSL